MELEANVWYWTQQGMRHGEPPLESNAYVERREVEQLLERAHARGFTQGQAASSKVDT